MRRYQKALAQAIGQLECSQCGDDVEYCDNCDMPFEDEDEMFCNTNKHICKNCKDNKKK